VQTNVLIKEECILKNKNKFYPYKELSMFYNSSIKTFESHLILLNRYATIRIQSVNTQLLIIGNLFTVVKSCTLTDCILIVAYSCSDAARMRHLKIR
jgi:hypothetical protein